MTIAEQITELSAALGNVQAESTRSLAFLGIRGAQGFFMNAAQLDKAVVAARELGSALFEFRDTSGMDE